MPPIPSVTAIVSRIEKPEAGDTDDSLRAFLGAFTAKELRSACKNFHVKVRTKNANMDNKVGYQTMLVQLSHARRESEEAESDQRDKMLQGSEGQLVQALASTRKTRHCSFRLVNILFSEKFCDRLGSMGTQPKRRELDAGAVGGNNAFWKEVAVEYSNDREEYGRLVPRDGRFDAIDPGHIVLHDSEKLKQMWKDISAKGALRERLVDRPPPSLQCGRW
ncbi:hypothetical protein PF011_g22652 [Phytophthora fragariae]|uniref:Uncharacterized protein n=2 Tax=Phytophthora fragariae TaxID=53985 RepID=A0A6A3IEQ5_9STRA|nr:hypothetical protein PF011_g22652 [Phytophthora fragariae]